MTQLTVLPDTSYIDAVRRPGLYSIVSAVDGPEVGASYFLEVKSGSVGGVARVVQRVTNVSTGVSHVRARSNTGWLPWSQEGAGAALEVTPLPSGTDLDSVLDTGIYSVQNPPGLPTGKYFAFSVSGPIGSTDHTVQYVTNVLEGSVRYRALQTLGWSQWQQMANGPTGGGGDGTSYMIVFNGESNSGGYADNAELTAGELAVRAGVKILNNTTLTSFDDLDVGTNNLVGHALMTANITHGFEVSLANAITAGRFGTPPVYLVKTGQGGSMISEWEATDAYTTTMLDRIAAAKGLLAIAGVSVTPYVLISLGLNDAINGTASGTFQSGLLDHISRIRAELGPSTKIILTKFMSPMGTTAQTFNGVFDTIDAADANLVVVDTTGATLRDSYHWNAQGFRVIGERVWDALFGGAVPASPAINISVDGLASITGTGTIKYTTDGSVPHSGSATYSTPVQLADQQVIRAVALGVQSKNSAVVEDTYEVNAPVTEYIIWTNIQNATVASDYLTSNGTAPGGALSQQTIDGTLPFTLKWEFTNDAAGSLVVVALDTDRDTTYNWASGQTTPHLQGMTWASGSVYHTNGTYAALNGQGAPAPGHFKMEKSGNDLVMSRSTDGNNWTVYRNIAGILAGQTSLNVKVIFGTANVSRTVRVTLTR